MILDWLKGRTITAIRLNTEHSTAFHCGDAVLVVESLWRLRVAVAMRLTSDDHEQKFGRDTPVDGPVGAYALLRDREVQGVKVDDRCADLVFTLEGDTVLEVLTTSAGYESWELRAPTHRLVAVSGGTIESIET